MLKVVGPAPHGPNTHSVQKTIHWNLLDLEGALFTLDQKDVFPSPDDFICILQKCRTRRSSEHAKRVCAHISRFGYEADGLVGSHVVPTLVGCGCLSDAQEVFSRLAQKTVHAWTSLMLGHLECGDSWGTLDLYKKMREETVQPSTHTFVAALKACTELRDDGNGRSIHRDSALLGSEGDVYIGSSLVSMYATCGFLEDAEDACDKLGAARNVVTWNALIAGYCTSGSGQKALDCFDQMQTEGMVPSSVTYACILKACGGLSVKEKGRDVHAEISMKGLDSNVFVGSGLVDMYAKLGCIPEAVLVFDKLSVKNIVSWNALITGFGDYGFCGEAVECFEHMQNKEVLPNASTYACTFKACGCIQAFEKGREIHMDAVRGGFTGDIMVGTSLVDMYAKWGLLAEAQETFDALLRRGIVAWNALIAGYSEHGPAQRALDCFEKMQYETILPNSITYACILKACGSLGATDIGRDMHLRVSKAGLDANVFVDSSLVGMYVKCGSLSDADAVFKKMPLRNAVAWNLMIKAFGVSQDGSMAIKYFGDMQEQGVSPDTATFLCLLMACSRARMLDKGQEFLELMRESFAIAPSSEHVTCMVDLLARLGLLSEAEKLLKTLPSSPSRDMLTALLTSCGIHEKGDLGLKCFQQVVEIDSDRASPYVLMASTLATQQGVEVQCVVQSATSASTGRF